MCTEGDIVALRIAVQIATCKSIIYDGRMHFQIEECAS